MKAKALFVLSFLIVIPLLFASIPFFDSQPSRVSAQAVQFQRGYIFTGVGNVDGPDLLKDAILTIQPFSDNKVYLPIVIQHHLISQSFVGMVEDGEVLNLDCTQDWNTCRSAPTGNAIWQNIQSGTVGATSNINGYTIQRVFLYFDTSSLPANAQIQDAYLRIYAGQWQNGNNKIHVVQSTAGLPLQASDFSKISFISGGTVTPAPNSWVDIPLSVEALNWVTKGGITSLALIHDLDLNNVTPTQTNDILVSLAESPNKASLVVTYFSNE